MKEIMAHGTHFEDSFSKAKKGAVFYVLLSGVEWSPELRRNPPRIRLLENGKQGLPVRCEILDDWPGAPDYWPPARAPKSPEKR